MKCVKKDKTIKRVSDKEAARMVQDQGYEYCPKKEWKEKIRDKRKEK